METVTIELDPELRKSLREVAQREGRSEPELLLEALRQYLQAPPQQAFHSLGIGRDGEIPATKIKAWVRANWRPDADWRH